MMVYLDLPYKTELPTECHKCGAVEIQTYTDGIIFAQLINQKNWRVHHTELATEPQVFKMVCLACKEAWEVSLSHKPKEEETDG